jgi:hypothetical protein
MIVLIIIGIAITFWLSTIRFFTTTQGQLSVLTFLGEHISVIGIGIPEIEVAKIKVGTLEILDNATAKDVVIRIDSQRPFQITAIPYKIATFDYSYKKYKTLKEVRETNGKIRWQPTPEKDKDDKKIENGPDTIVLGEWKEIARTGLYLREREESYIPFQSQDGVLGVIGCYIKFFVWDMSLAISTTHNFKTDPEKAIIDTTQNWAKSKNYLNDIKGVSFEGVILSDQTFLQQLNRDIYLTGIIVEGIEFTSFYVEPESRDVLEAQEKIEKNKILFLAEESNKKLKEKQAEGDALKTTIAAKATADSINMVAAAKAQEIEITGKAKNLIETDLDKKLKTNEVDQLKTKLETERENAVKEFDSKTKITLEANSKVIEKIGELKKIPDATEKAKYDALALSKVTTLMMPGADNTSGDKLDELLQSQIITNQISQQKK